MMQFNDLGKQYQLYKKEIDEAIQQVLNSHRYIMGGEVFELEEQLAQYVGTKHCISTASGTDSLLMALMALGIGPGDEVITVPFTWISSSEVIKLLGAKPVFVDIDPETYLLDVDQVEAAITSKTKAILPIDIFGQLADYDRLNETAMQHGLTIIQDAAQSFGALQHGRKSCSQGQINCTSFFPAKPLGCYGDGGAMFTDDDSLANALRAIRTHGGERRHHHTHVGINGRLDTIQAAILLVKMRHFDEELSARMAIGKRYTEALKGVCMIPTVADSNTHIYAQYTIRVEDREAFQSALKEQGIPTAVYYPKCLHVQPVFSDLGYSIGDFPHCEKASDEVVSLPLHPWLTKEDQDRVIEGVVNFCQVPAYA
jgi:UDP-2-acetamido-2-deoxy-ribo-hexuluronate aminotransferase